MAQPKGDAYKKKVRVPKVWEEILIKGVKERILVTENVSKYIRSLEKTIKKLKK